jgi:hypothetical protein
MQTLALNQADRLLLKSEQAARHPSSAILLFSFKAKTRNVRRPMFADTTLDSSELDQQEVEDGAELRKLRQKLN